jgi:type IV pilus assembly protein PilX
MNFHEVQTMNPTMPSLGNFRSRRRQRGVVLIVSLILLLVVTLLAVSSMQGTSLEEKMAGNTRDRNLAFQTTESAIREAETYIESIVSLGSFNGAAGLFGLTDTEPYFAMDTTWSDATQHVVADSDYSSYGAPRYYIKHFTTVKGIEGAMNMAGYGDNKGTGDASIFKITGRGTGGSADSAEVILRSHYGRIF